MDGKAKLAVLGDRPLVAETQAELLDDNVTPTDKLFIRNNGQVPDITGDPKAWKIKIDGEVNTPIEITVGDLMSRFPTVTYQLMLECGGNGRSFFSPEARGNQWTNGGAGCPMWTGVRLADVLKAAGLKSSAVYIGSLRRRSDPGRRDRQAHHLARRADRQGDGGAHADRLQAERPGHAADPRRAGAPRRAGLARARPRPSG